VVTVGGPALLLLLLLALVLLLMLLRSLLLHPAALLLLAPGLVAGCLRLFPLAGISHWIHRLDVPVAVPGSLHLLLLDGVPPQDTTPESLPCMP